VHCHLVSHISVASGKGCPVTGEANSGRKGLIVAIDGPSGAGKSTITRRLADALSYVYIDTGAMYRACALAVKRSGIPPEHEADIVALCGSLELSFRIENGISRIILNDEDVADLIRTPEISLLTSTVARMKGVRDLLLIKQREMGAAGGVILEGRDIGTVVFPNAEAKFFLSATAEERGKRRYLELTAKGETVDLERTIAEVIARDRQDEGRDHAPLRQADDAISLDSTKMTIDEVVAAMALVINERSLACGGT
jgi:cytidylate kinase